jgi:hypothetical protein
MIVINHLCHHRLFKSFFAPLKTPQSEKYILMKNRNYTVKRYPNKNLLKKMHSLGSGHFSVLPRFCFYNRHVLCILLQHNSKYRWKLLRKKKKNITAFKSNLMITLLIQLERFVGISFELYSASDFAYNFAKLWFD